MISTTSDIFGYSSENPKYNNGPNGVNGPKENVRHFAELLFELSKYDPDLKAILDNSKLSVNQNQDTGFGVNPYNMSNGQIEPNPFENLNIEGSGENVNPNEDKHSNIEKIDNINENNIAEVTADSIYNLLTSQQYEITVDVSKLPEYLRLIVNQLTNSNSLNNQNEMGTENTNYSATALSSQNNMQSNNATDKQNDAQSVVLNSDQFQELIYYFMINAVAKENCMTVTDNCDYSKALTEAKQAITGQCHELGQQTNNCNQIERIRKCAPDEINQTVSNLKNDVENGELQRIIKNNLENKNESSGFWVQFLCSVLQRASFFYSIYKIFACNQKLKAFDTLTLKQKDIDKAKFMDRQKLESDRKNHLIDTFLSIPQILLLLSLIFGFGAIANVILGLIVLATFVYKFINQYPKQKQKFLVYKLLQFNYLENIARQNGFALTPEVAKIYQCGEQAKENIKQIAEKKLNSINQNTLGYAPGQTQEQYPSFEQIN